MGQISLYIIASVIMVVVCVSLVSRREAKKHGTSAKEEFVGICRAAIETASQKDARKQKILSMLQDQGELSNSEIRQALGVSSRTAVRYLDELEKEGRVEQVGAVGHAVTYRLK